MKLVAGPGVETPAQARAERIDRGGPPATGAPTAAYESRPFLKVRRGYADVLTASRRKDIVHGLFEIDATLARSLLHDLRSSGVDVSFTAFLVHALAQAVDEDRSVQAYRRHHRLIIFDDVDVNTQIETTIDGQRLAQTLMIRAANRKTVNELTSEIRRAQHRDPTAQRRYRRTLLFLTSRDCCGPSRGGSCWPSPPCSSSWMEPSPSVRSACSAPPAAGGSRWRRQPS